MTKQQENKVQI